MKTFIAFAVIATIFFSFPSKANAQADLTLAAVVKELGDQLQQTIEDAKNAGLNIEVEAGRQVSLSLESFQNVYASSMNLTMNKVDTVATHQLEQIKSMVSDISNVTSNTLNDFTSKAQVIVNSLPFRSHEPQVSSISPKFIVPSNIFYEVVIRCKGNFEAAGLPGYTPTFTIGTTTFTSTGDNQNLEFHIPITIFTSNISLPSNSFGYIQAQLNIPWKESKVLGIIKSKQVDSYKFYLGTLPKQPGIITLIHMIDNPRHSVRSFLTKEMYQSSAGDAGNNDEKDVPKDITPDLGWHVTRGTSIFHVNWSKGIWSQSFSSDDADHVIYKVTTIHVGLRPFSHDDSGQVKFVIGFQEYLDDTYQTYKTDQINLAWGDQYAFNDAPGKWKIQFKGFDGSNVDITGVDSNNPFIKVSNEGMNYIISTANPNMLQWP